MTYHVPPAKKNEKSSPNCHLLCISLSALPLLCHVRLGLGKEFRSALPFGWIDALLNFLTLFRRAVLLFKLFPCLKEVGQILLGFLICTEFGVSVLEHATSHIGGMGNVGLKHGVGQVHLVMLRLFNQFPIQSPRVRELLLRDLKVNKRLPPCTLR
eukprot:NODE_6890_length_526_cov_19.316562_g6460_i0.p1 GENE.NODE_6890_length_526_cov_19.316562_g6460_i0~~NODE_6890_length_526_cov_19.316562_g6460_i0.p1  ORF type:complete len:156 (-),score=12.36 NODE_6890_length_526_cov_19.316562_g6460_i0:47-514(-)